jgi:hypothetical protein
MKTNEQGDVTMACTGRMFSANAGVIGITEDGRVFDGYDGGMDVMSGNGCGRGGAADEVMTPEERRELALAMVRRWLKFAKDVT